MVICCKVCEYCLHLCEALTSPSPPPPPRLSYCVTMLAASLQASDDKLDLLDVSIVF